MLIAWVVNLYVLQAMWYYLLAVIEHSKKCGDFIQSLSDIH